MVVCVWVDGAGGGGKEESETFLVDVPDAGSQTAPGLKS